MRRNKPATEIDMEALTKDVEVSPDAYLWERAERFNVKLKGERMPLERLLGFHLLR